MRQKLINIYKFNELDKETQDRIIEKFRENNDYPFLFDNITETCKDLLKENNIEILSKFDINYDLSYSQGSGAMFTGSFKWDKYYVTITHQGHYNHYNSKNIELNIIDEPEDTQDWNDTQWKKWEEEKNNDEKYFNEIYISICKEMEKIEYDQIKYEDSEEVIKENIEANEYEFYDNGEIA